MIEFLQNNWELILATASPFLVFLFPLFNFIRKNTKLEKLVDKIKSDLNINQSDLIKITESTEKLKEIANSFLINTYDLYNNKKDELVKNVKIIIDEANSLVEKMNIEIKKNRAEMNSVVSSFNDFILNLGIPELKEMIVNAKNDSVQEKTSTKTDPL